MDTTFPALIAAPTARTRLAGRIVSALAVLLLSFDAAIKLAHIQPVTDSLNHLGLPQHTALVIGLVELACVALYLAPRTAVLGAVLLTGFFGGAVALHLRVGDPLASHTLFPIYMGIVVWLGLYLRDTRVRSLAATILGGQR